MRRINLEKFPKLKELKLCIGCGDSVLDNPDSVLDNDEWIGLDKGDYGQEILWDLAEGIPLPDDSCKRILADNVLEHIGPNDDFILVMNECLRVLKPEGRFEILVPFWSSPSAHKDPTHCRYFDTKTFSYFEDTNKWLYGIDKRWKVKECYRPEKQNNRVYATLIAKK